MKVNCLSCGHSVDLRESYDDYDGQVRCWICGALFALRTENGQVRYVELVASGGRAPDSSTYLSG